MRTSYKQIGNCEKRSPATTESELFQEVVAHLRLKRASLREEWARRIHEAELLTAMTSEEIFMEATAMYDNYVKALETGSVKDLQAYARDLSKRIIHRGVETHEVLGIVLLLRDVLARSLFKKYNGDFELLSRVFDAYEPAANRIANTVAVSFVEQRERVIRRQHKAIQILHVQEEERKRISRELHDEVGQALTAINTHLALGSASAGGTKTQSFERESRTSRNCWLARLKGCIGLPVRCDRRRWMIWASCLPCAPTSRTMPSERVCWFVSSEPQRTSL